MSEIKPDDKFLINRDGVDYKATVDQFAKDINIHVECCSGDGGAGGSVHWDDIEGKPCIPECEGGGCVEVLSITEQKFGDFANAITAPDGYAYFFAVGYHPDFGWRALVNKKGDNEKVLYLMKAKEAGPDSEFTYDLDNWELVQVLDATAHQSLSSEMVVVGNKLQALIPMMKANGNNGFAAYRFDISESGATQTVVIESDNFTYSDQSNSHYDQESKTWYVGVGYNSTIDDSGDEYESWTYNEETGTSTKLDWNVLDRLTVDGQLFELTATGINGTELWGATQNYLPNNASIKYSPKLDQIVATVSLVEGFKNEEFPYLKNLFDDAKNLWVSNDRGASWTVIDTEPDPDWEGEIVRWSGIDWIPDGINKLGTKGFWVAQSLRGSNTPEYKGHLHTMTSVDGINWDFEYGYKWDIKFDGKYTVFDGEQYIVTSNGSSFSGSMNSTPTNRLAFRSETCAVRQPAIATVADTGGLSSGMKAGEAEIIEVIDDTSFSYTGTLAVGDEACFDASGASESVHWDNIEGKPDCFPACIDDGGGTVHWDDIEGKPCIPECKPPCAVALEYIGQFDPDTEWGPPIFEGEGGSGYGAGGTDRIKESTVRAEPGKFWKVIDPRQNNFMWPSDMWTWDPDDLQNPPLHLTDDDRWDHYDNVGYKGKWLVDGVEVVLLKPYWGEWPEEDFSGFSYGRTNDCGSDSSGGGGIQDILKIDINEEVPKLREYAWNQVTSEYENRWVALSKYWPKFGASADEHGENIEYHQSWDEPISFAGYITFREGLQSWEESTFTKKVVFGGTYKVEIDGGHINAALSCKAREFIGDGSKLTGVMPLDISTLPTLS